jgi:hypothetical protein
VGEEFADFARRKQPLTPGCAVPAPLGEGRYQMRPRRESKCRNSRGGARIAFLVFARTFGPFTDPTFERLKFNLREVALASGYTTDQSPIKPA